MIYSLIVTLGNFSGLWKAYLPWPQVRALENLKGGSWEGESTLSCSGRRVSSQQLEGWLSGWWIIQILYFLLTLPWSFFTIYRPSLQVLEGERPGCCNWKYNNTLWARRRWDLGQDPRIQMPMLSPSPWAKGLLHWVTNALPPIQMSVGSWQGIIPSPNHELSLLGLLGLWPGMS